MRAIQRFAKWLGYEKPDDAFKRGFETALTRSFSAAITGRLTEDWMTSNQSADSALRYDVKTMRDRSRDQERNENYIRRYFKLVENNVLGANGVALQMKIKEMGPKGAEQYDDRANRIIEDGFWKWGRKEFCTVNKSATWAECQRLGLRSAARDGGALFRKHYPRENPFMFALEPMEIDHLDVDHNTHGGAILVKMGVEYDAGGTVIAYHVKRTHPGETFH